MLTRLLLSWNTPPCSWTFSASCFSMQLPVAADRDHHPYIWYCFCRKHFSVLVSFLFMECKLLVIWTRAMYINLALALNSNLFIQYKCTYRLALRIWRTLTNVNSANFGSKQLVNSAHLSRRQHRSHRLHRAAHNSIEHCRKNPSPEKAGELRALTWKMYLVDLLSNCVLSTLSYSNSAALG